ncbi:hypothetical protein ABPG75_003108 [Micractinium tetrahymenae]
MGVFSFEDAFRRLKARCPAAAQPCVEKAVGEQATRQQRLAALQQVLVQPECTLAASTLFRPVLLKAVAGLVEGALSSSSGATSSSSAGHQIGPELAVALLAVLELAPHTDGPVLRYFRSAPAPFQYLLATDGSPPVELPAGLSPAQLARATLRGLQLLPQLHWPVAAVLPVLLQHPEADVRWCAVECAALVFGLRDASRAKLAGRVLAEDEGAACTLRWQNERALFAAELAAMYSSSPAEGSGGGGQQQGGRDEAMMGAEPSATAASKSRDNAGSRKRKFGEGDDGSDSDAATQGGPGGLAAAPGYVEVCGLELPQRQQHSGGGSTVGGSGSGPQLVHTPAVGRNLEALALGLCLGSPILVEGPPGSGKSVLIEHVAALTGNSAAMVRIHLDDQMDSKSLMGAYICTARPGEFVWQPGPLTQAVAQGRWVLIEDINLAPAEVLAALVPLLERRQLAIAARAESVTAAPGFQLIATVTSAPGGTAAGAYGSSQEVKDLLGGLFHYVAVEPPPEAEQQRILARLHPQLAPLLPHAMDTLALVRAAYGQAQHGQALSEAAAAALAAAGVAVGGGGGGAFGFSVGRHFSIRDLLKWCRRMGRLHAALLQRSLKPGRAAQYRASVAAVPVVVREVAFVEAADCFCALLGRAEAGERLLAALAALWAVPSEAVQQYVALHKPAVQAGAADLAVGRATLPLLDAAAGRAALAASAGGDGSRFAPTGHALRNMERVAAAASLGEPVLLVGETGTGKTTLVQQIAKQVGARLVVLNLSQQTDSGDLLGGFRPVQPAEAVLPLLDRFADLVRRTWWRGNNEEFLGRVARLAEKRKWGQLVKAFRTALDKVAAAEAANAGGEQQGQQAQQADGGSSKKQKRSGGKPKKGGGGSAVNVEALREWRAFSADLAAAEAAATAAEGGFAFAFVEGALVKAVREGWWLLLDEMNLAPAEALERIAGLLEEAGSGGLVIAERGDAEGVPRHPNFRLFGAMNPATDAGKRDLPAPLRNRFTEIWVGEPPQRADLAAIVAGYLAGVVAGAPVQAIVDFYLAAKAEAEANLQDGAGHKPAYNLRTLCRALEYAARATPTYGLQRSLWDGFAMSFLTQLDPPSGARLEKLMQQHLLGPGTSLKVLLRAPPAPPGPDHVLFDQFWVGTGGGPLPGHGQDGSGGAFVLTPTVQGHLRNLARAVLLRCYPILLQGPTSSGKTSLVSYLAAQTGHTFVRINNHEQTDLQEYLGSYVSDESGRLVFREGLLVQAVRRGHWIVLDELNLAPTEVLEALNRLLDDNRELYVPELQEVVHPHPHFMLFATQNPPGIYAGRKTLSRAFRSRFLELHVDDIPDEELTTILEKRCAIAPSYAAKLVAVQRELQRRRSASNVFAGRHGFITPRDLFRWAGRGAVGYQQLAEDGFAVLGERLRSAEERAVVAEVLEKVLGAKLNMAEAYERRGDAPLQQLRASLEQEAAAAAAAAERGDQQPPPAQHGQQQQRSSHSVADVAALRAALGGVVWTASMRRIYCLLERCLEFAEPALLCGETGTGKTTVCQMAAFVRGQRLHIINCNQHTEVSDFLGGFRPNRHRERSLVQLQQALAALNASPLLPAAGLPALAPPATPGAADLQGVVAEARQRLDAAAAYVRQQGEAASRAAGRKAQKAQQKAQQQLEAQLAALQAAVASLVEAAAGVRAPFEWADGPLVQAMKRGDMILVDELNLAEDAVLERLNSVLEPGRSLTLAEKGGAGAELVVAHPAFRIVATMNPGGDYGKKELSPALSNRFTSIWVPAIEDVRELRAILESRLPGEEAKALIAPRLLDFWRFFRSEAAHAARQALSVRDLLAWAGFIAATAPQLGLLPAYAHGAHLVLLDGIGLGVGLSAEASQQLRDRCHAFLLTQLPPEVHAAAKAAAGRGALPGDEAEAEAAAAAGMEVDDAERRQEAGPGRWGIAPFFVEQRVMPGGGAPGARFNFQAPTTGRNALRVLRALQLRKPILLEGSPGVGKTSLIAAMAKAVGAELVRINLSEQTDMMDLLGADLPVAGGAPGEFAWADGPLLSAVKSGAWVLLDELNLAGQTVLEGLNAVLDHRAEVFIPELNRTFRCPPTFRVFGAQNPLQEGGGRKGLPKSFLNRFTRVHVELLQQTDLLFIASALHPRIPAASLARMVAALQRLHHDANVSRVFAGAGGPWELNLRDLLRWCELAESAVPAAPAGADAQQGGGEAAALDSAVQHYASLLFLQRLRTAADRRHAATVFAEAWGADAMWQGRQGQQPELHISPEALQVGWACLPRTGPTSAGALNGDSDSAGLAAPLALLPGQLPVLESLAECAARGWMCLLVGPAAGGKTAAVRGLAALAGQPLLELSLTSGTDTSDLLGGFEQVEPARKVQEAARQAQALLAAAAELLLPALRPTAAEHQQLLASLSAACAACAASAGLDAAAAAAGAVVAAAPSAEAQHAQQLAAVQAVQAVLGQLQQVLGALRQLEGPSDGGATPEGSSLQQQVAQLEASAAEAAARAAELAAGLASGGESAAGKFEWVDGALTRAIERGQWVLLDSANLCNPTVLDRLNPLLEPQGVLLLNECGGGGAGPRIVRPHPNFRLFLALEPRHGEVSRAMRNRGIEIFLLPKHEEEAAAGAAGAAAQQGSQGQRQQEQQGGQQAELVQVLGLAGVPGTAVPRAMAAAHAAVAAHAAQRHRRPPGLRELLRWAALTAALASRGWQFGAALEAAWRQLYVRSDAASATGAEEAAAVAEAAFQAYLQPLLQEQQQGSSGDGDLILYRPAAWPLPLGIAVFASDSAAACTSRDVAVLLLQLTVVAATELQQWGDGSAAAEVLASRAAWANDLGLAAAAAMPAAGLLRLLQGSSSSSSRSSSSSDSVTDSHGGTESALLCAPAAARVFAERCGPGQHKQRAALMAALSLQLQRLLGAAGAAGGPAELAAQQASRLVSGVLAHPLAVAAADLQQQLAVAVQLPAAGRAFLPLDATSSQQLQPFLLAAGLQPRRQAESSNRDSSGSGSNVQQLWQQVQEVSSKVAALWQAVQAAVVLQSAASAADAAVAAGSATLLQLSHWRHQRPKERARRAALHPTVDWLYAALAAVQGLEEALLVPPSAGQAAAPAWNEAVLAKLRGVQQWRWALLRSLHQDPASAQPGSLAAHYEGLLFQWMRLRKAVAALLAETGGPQAGTWADAVQRWGTVSEQLDAAAGIATGAAPPKPLLWKHGGRPLLPCTLPLSEAYCALLGLCDAVMVGASGFTADHRGQPAALAAAGIQLPLLEMDGSAAEASLGAEERALVAAAAAAEVAADPALRAALVEGLCLFVSGALLAQQPGQAAPAGSEAQLAGVLELLRGRVQQRAEEAAAGAAALLATRVLAATAGEEDDEDGGMAAADSSSREQQPQGVLVPAVQLTWGDEPAGAAAGAVGSGLLPAALPAELMQFPSCRTLQLQLLALQDARLASIQLQAFAGGALLRLLLQSGNSSAALAPLRHVVADMAAGSGGGASAADAATYQLLLWLLEAQQQQQQQGAAAGDAGSEWQQLLQRSLVQEAWFRWQQGLWAGAAAALPAAHAACLAPAAHERWAAAAAGPLRLHIAAGTVLATAVTAGPPALIADRSARLLQLKLATRQLRLAATQPASLAATAAAESQAAAAVAAAMLAAHLPSVPEQAQRAQLKAVLAWLASERCAGGALEEQAERDAQLLQLVGEALGASTHPVLRGLLQPVVLPALEGLLQGIAGAACPRHEDGLAARGRVWALLALARLHLLLPPAGADPAAKYGLVQRHALSMLHCQVEPELAVRRQAAALPGGPDEGRAIAELEARAAELAQQAERLERRSTPRPTPPQYLTLRDDVERFVSSFGAVPRLLEIISQLSSSSPDKAAAGATQAAVWQQNAAAWAERLGRQYPLYRDIVQPVQLAVQELRYGLALLAGRAALAADQQSTRLAPVLARLMAFPRAAASRVAGTAAVPGDGAAALLDSPEVQQAVGDAAAAGAEARLCAALASSGSSDAAEKAKRAAYAAAMSARLQLLRCSLSAAARDVQAGQLGAGSGAAAAADVAAAQARLHFIFMEFVGAWEDVKAEEERRAAAEAEVFKHKTRATDIATEEQEAEDDYHRQFPDQFSTHFADLAPDEAPDTLAGDSEAAVAAAAAAAAGPSTEEEALGAAVLSARELVVGEVLGELVAVHATAFGGSGSGSGSDEAGQAGDTAAADFLRSYQLGVELLRAAGLVLPASLDGATASGHLYAAACRFRQLSQAAPSAAAAAKAGVDMQAPCVEEAVLVQAPVLALRGRLQELLEEWPDHPGLLQLSAVIDRLLGMPVTAPLKAMLTGVELLLAKGQLWEETAARHVSLAPQLAPLSALATRWRRLELAAWRGLLSATWERAAAVAHQAWFHLYRILLTADDLAPAEVAPTVETFVQSSPLGEFASRLALLEAFSRQLAAMSAAAPAASKDGAAGHASTQRQQQQRWAALSAVLANVARYYRQFQPAVDAQVAAGMAELEKALQDFVALAKWEDRGYYALRANNEKAQRQLHRLTRRATLLLREPATGALAAAAKGMGLPDLQQHQQAEAAAAAAAAATPGKKKKGKKAAEAAPAAEAAAEAERALAEPATAAAVLAAARGAALQSLQGAQAAAALPLLAGSKYAPQLPRLTRRFAEVASTAVGTEAAAAGAAAANDLASEAAERALALKADVAKGAKARKKKALTDFFRALADAGVSRRRTAVPASQRGSQAWFAQQVAHPVPLLEAAGAGQGASPQAEAQAAAAARLWVKADRYYFGSMARLQRLWEAAKQPHGDLSGAEVEGAVRSVEHLLWLTQRSRAVLGALSKVHSQLSTLHAALASLAPAGTDQAQALPPQGRCCAWFHRQRATLAVLLQQAEETAELLAAAAGAETAATPRNQLQAGAQQAAAAAAAVRECSTRLAAASEGAVPLPPAPGSSDGGSATLFLPAAVLAALQANTSALQALQRQLETARAEQQQDQGQSEALPGWTALLAAVTAAASESAAASTAPAPAPQPPAALEDQRRQLAAQVEAAVAAALVWAQNAKPTASAAPADAEQGEGQQVEEAEAEQQPLPELLQQLEGQLGLHRVEELRSHIAGALAAVAAASDTAPALAAAEAATAAAGLAPLLGLLLCALRQLGLQYLAVHKAASKLCYISASLFAGLVQEGFCMPEGAEGEAEEGGEGKVTEGTGLGEGDTTGAKDISNELEDQDQLLGAKQKGAEEAQQEQEDQQAPQEQKQDQGVEMDDDFEGALEDVAQDQQQSGGESDGEEEEDGERVDQQMGETGEEGEDVDERLWNDEDREQDQGGQEPEGPDDKAVQVGDKSQLDYAAGDEEDQEQPGEQEGQQQAQQEQEQEQQEAAQQPGAEEEQEEKEPLGDYQDRPEDRGHVQPEGQEQEFELPEDLNLDGGEAGEEAEEQPADMETEEQPAAAEQEQGGAFPEQQPAAEEGGQEEQAGGEDEEMEEAGAPPGGDAAAEEQQAQEPGQQQAGEAEGMEAEEEEEEQPPEEDAMTPDAGQAEEQQEQPQAEAGPLGLFSAAAAAAAADQGTGNGAAEQEEPQQTEEQRQPAGADTAAPAAAAEPPPGAGGSAAGASDGLQDDPASPAAAASGRDQQQQRQKPAQRPQSDANPFRNLGGAMERWRARLNIAADAAEHQQPAGEEPEAAVAEQSEHPPAGGEQEPAGGEHRFLGQQEQQQAGDTQALAPATEEQAAAQVQQEGQDDEAADGTGEAAAAAEEAAGEQEEDAMDAEQQGGAPEQQLMSGAANWGAGGDRKAGLEAGEPAAEQEQLQEEEAAESDEDGEGKGGEEEAAADAGGPAVDASYVAARLQRATLEDGAPAEEEWVLGGLSEEAAAALREQLDARLRAASEGSAQLPDAAAEAHGREVWARCEALTAGLVGELAEQLRLILEPTLASRLAGDYRSGKRINMKKVIGYIASHFRKDKIWMRRTRPDKRKYQVVVAVDDSRSMAETGCGSFALEALTLICRAMARLEVGELGVVSFGGGGGAVPLHPLERPFTDGDGVRVMSQMRFDQDNTISDRPMVDVLTSLDHMLAGAAARAGSAGNNASLHQLVLVVADGRFHEKESLRRKVHAAADKPGVLYAFIVLDNPANSILDMQTVSFVGGKPVFAKYMDSFPFPYYIVLRDTAALPRTLADLLRQWFELSR